MKLLPLKIMPVAALFCLVSCGQNNTGYILNGRIADAGDGKAVLSAYAEGQIVPAFSDTVTMKKGKFAFKGTVENALNCAVVVIPDGRQPASFYMMIENAKIEATGNWKNVAEQYGQRMIDSMTITGSRNTDFIYRATEIQKATKDRDEMLRQMRQLIVDNPDLPAAAQQLNVLSSMMTLDELESAFNALQEPLRNSTMAAGVRDEIEALKNIQPGKPAPEITGTDINGEDFKLSDLKGKYVIVDFWASWCAPCRAGNPHMLELWKKYHNKGLEIVCIADNDSSPDKWRDAVEKDKIGAFYHILRGLKKSDTGGYDRSEDRSKAYAVHALPTKYLIGADGTIIGKMHDKELDSQLQQIFGF